MDENQKEKLIEEEYQRLSALFSAVDSNERAVLDPLLRNVAFMSVTLSILQKTINENGAVEHYRNGRDQEGLKPSSALQAFNALSKNYAQATKTLRGYLPKADQVSAAEIYQYNKYKKEAEEYASECREIKGLMRDMYEALREIRDKYNIDDADFEPIEKIAIYA